MKYKFVFAGIVGSFLMLAGSAFGQATAHADLVNGAGQKIGSATLAQTPAGVKIAVEAAQVPPGTHGIHIHAVESAKARTSRPPAGTSIQPERSTEKIVRMGRTTATC